MTQPQIKCPYCQFDIPSTAAVCGHCTKELSLVKPLMVSMDALKNELALLKTEVAELRTRSVYAAVSGESQHEVSGDLQAQLEFVEPEPKISGTQSILIFVGSLLCCAAVSVSSFWFLWTLRAKRQNSLRNEAGCCSECGGAGTGGGLKEPGAGAPIDLTEATTGAETAEPAEQV